eukprot:2327079-Rhodomonas_salina.1
MSGTDRVPIVYRTSYAMSGTDLVPVVLCTPYAMSSTAHPVNLCGIRHRRRSTDLSIVVCRAYAVSGTEKGYAATRELARERCPAYVTWPFPSRLGQYRSLWTRFRMCVCLQFSYGKFDIERKRSAILGMNVAALFL